MGAEIAITVVASKLIDKAVNKLIDKLVDKRATTLRLNIMIPLNNLANECVNLLHNFSTFFLFKKSMNLPKEWPVDLTMNASANQNTNLRLSIEVKQLSKQVSDATGTLNILQEIDFTAQEGETLAIVGASGSGKSTLLGILAGLDTPSEGKVILDGIDIFALDEDGRAQFRKEKLGFVFQSFQLLAHLSALENVMLPLELRGDSQARNKATEMLGRVGLSSRLQHYPKYLSGGEQQRVALARAFVTEPPLLFADEPTGSLDAVTGEAVIQLMFALNRERGSTLVLVTHDLSIAARCARTIKITAGRLDLGV